VYIKDLRIFSAWDLKDIVIIDNSAFSFGFNVNNGVPILSYYDSTEDKELYHLIDYLEMISKAEDVRKINKEAFRLLDIVEEYFTQAKVEIGSCSN
jgi:CTD small phosphatase-like protein 2